MAILSYVPTNKRPQEGTKEHKDMTLKIVKNSVKNVEDDYIRLISTADNETATNLIRVTTESGWISAEITKEAGRVAHYTGKDYDYIRELICNQFIVNALNQPEKDAKYVKSSIKFASKYVQKVVFSDMAKVEQVKWGMGYIQGGGHVDNSITVAVDQAKAEMIDDLLASLIKRHDQKDFIALILTYGAGKAQEMLELETKDFNRKVERALESIKRGRNKDEYKYMMSLLGEILETAYETPLTEQEEMDAFYKESISSIF